VRGRTRADPEPGNLPIRDVYGIGEGCAEGAQARSTDDTHLWLEVLWDALSKEFETSIERQLSKVGHIVPRERERQRSGRKCLAENTDFPFLSTSLPLSFFPPHPSGQRYWVYFVGQDVVQVCSLPRPSSLLGPARLFDHDGPAWLVFVLSDLLPYPPILIFLPYARNENRRRKPCSRARRR